jgi:hypothetical protein
VTRIDSPEFKATVAQAEAEFRKVEQAGKHPGR